MCIRDSYGGAYLNNEGNMVVKVVNKTSEEIEKDLITRCGGNGSIVDLSLIHI